MHNKTLVELSQQLASGAISSVELTQHFLDRIKQFDPKLNSFISVTEELALSQAINADKLRAKGSAGILTGIPIAHKDIFCTQNGPTRCCSNILEGFEAPYDAHVITRLKFFHGYVVS